MPVTFSLIIELSPLISPVCVHIEDWMSVIAEGPLKYMY
jgi:hypothetical protein